MEVMDKPNRLLPFCPGYRCSFALATGGVKDRLPPIQARVYLLNDEQGNHTRGVKLARVPGGLQILNELLANVPKHMAIIRGIEIKPYGGYDVRRIPLSPVAAP